MVLLPGVLNVLVLILSCSVADDCTHVKRRSSHDRTSCAGCSHMPWRRVAPAGHEQSRPEHGKAHLLLDPHLLCCQRASDIRPKRRSIDIKLCLWVFCTSNVVSKPARRELCRQRCAAASRDR
jgi:hypothetical protein